MKRDQIYIDSGAWIALMIPDDQYHRRAVDWYSNLSHTAVRLTSSQVISETYTWLRYKAGYWNSSRFLEVIGQSQLQSRLTVIYENRDTCEQAVQILRNFPDQKLSFADALSMSMMQYEGIHKVFTFDQHFHLMGFEVVPQ